MKLGRWIYQQRQVRLSKMAGKPSFSFINDGRWHYQKQQVAILTVAKGHRSITVVHVKDPRI